MSISTFIQGLTTSGSDVLDLKLDINKKTETIKNLRKDLQGERDGIHTIQRDHQLEVRGLREEIKDTLHSCSKDIVDVKENAAKDIREAERGALKTTEEESEQADAKVKKAEAEIKIVKDDSENKVRRMKEECGSRMGILKTETEAKIKDVKLTANKEAEEAMEKLIDGLQEEISDVQIVSARSEARSEERLDTIESLKSQMTDYKEFVKYAMTKLPDVKLDKFNINVDVPATTVVNKTEVVKSK